MNQERNLGMDQTKDDLQIHALVVALALRELDWEVSPENVVLALEMAEPSTWVTSLLRSRASEWSEDFMEDVARASDLAAMLASLDAPASRG